MMKRLEGHDEGHDEGLAELLEKYEDFFNRELGCLKSRLANLQLKENAHLQNFQSQDLYHTLYIQVNGRSFEKIENSEETSV